MLNDLLPFLFGLNTPPHKSCRLVVALVLEAADCGII